MASSVLDEFGSTARSTSVRLTFEAHHQTKRAFETEDLLQICQIFLGHLQGLLSESVEPELLYRILVVLQEVRAPRSRAVADVL